MFIDIHSHCHKPRHPAVRRADGCWPTPEEWIAMMDAHGIAMAVVHGCVSPEWRWTLVIPEEVLEICARYPDRLIPFCNLDPRFLDNTAHADFRPLLSAYKEMGCRGVGEYFPNLAFDDPLNLNLFRQVGDIGLPLTFHIATGIGGQYGCYDDPGLPRLETALKHCPDLVFLGHSQPFWAEIGRYADTTAREGYPSDRVEPGRLVNLMRRYPNLHGDLSANSGLNAISRDIEFGCSFLEEFQDRLYFGTDTCRPGQQVSARIVDFFHRLESGRLISVQAYEKITWRNAARLLGLDIAG